MIFCKNCGTPLEDGVRFCNNCGTPIEAQPQYETVQQTSQVQTPYEPAQPVYQQPIYQQPVNPNPYANPYVQPQVPQPSVASKVLGIIGMALGIEGLVYSIIMLLCTLVIAALSTDPYVFEEMSEVPVMFVTYNFIGLAQGIAALILGSKARNKGNISAMPRVAKGMGIATIALSAVGILLSLTAI